MKQSNMQLYTTACVRELSSPNPLMSFNEIVDEVLSKHKGQVVKREDLVNSVAAEMGCFPDSSVSGAVSNKLRKLEKKGVVAQAQHGFWFVV